MSQAKFIKVVKMQNNHFNRILVLMMFQFIISNLFFSKPVTAQSCNEVTLNEAVKYYELGKFDLVIGSLEKCIKSVLKKKVPMKISSTFGSSSRPK